MTGKFRVYRFKISVAFAALFARIKNLFGLKKKLSLGLAGITLFTALPLAVAAIGGQSDEPQRNYSANAKDTAQPADTAAEVPNAEATPPAQNQASSSDSKHTQVTINGQPITVPSNGSTHTQVNNSGDNLTVDVNVEQKSTSSSGGSTSSSSSTSINVSGNSSTEITTGTDATDTMDIGTDGP